MNSGSNPLHPAHPLPASWLGSLALALVAVAVSGPLPGASAWRVASLLLVAPLLEEIVFRGGLQEALLRRRWAPAMANALTALAFGLSHLLTGSWAWALARVLPALAIGHVYQRTRRVAPCVAWHTTFNALWLIAAAVPASSVFPQVLP